MQSRFEAGAMIRVSQPVVGDEELAAVKVALERGYYGHAEKVLEFEDRLRNYLNAPEVVCVVNGTAALHLSCDALGLGPGDEVLVPSITYVASFQAIAATGATPVACDVEGHTLLIDLEDARQRITAQTKAIMPVHYAGNAANMEDVHLLAEEYGLRVVEDAAHAFGSTLHGKKVGSFGDISCFSFDSIKTITCGEGGAIVSKDSDLAELIRQKRQLGIDRKSHPSASWRDRSRGYDVSTQGFRYHMGNINASIGLVQLGKVNEFITRRREICKRYDAAFRDVDGLRTLCMDYDEVAPHIYVIRVEDGRRDALMEFMRNCDIETGVNYIPNHLHTYFKHNGFPLPEAEQAYAEILTLPLHAALSDDDVYRVMETIIEFLGRSHE